MREARTRPGAASRPAAVLVPIYWSGSEGWRFVLVRRGPRGAHAGEIAFPGGKPERSDPDLAATAVREAAEETGVRPSGVELLTSLPIVQTRQSGFSIHPYLARITPPTRWAPDAREIDAVVPVAASALTDCAVRLPHHRAPIPAKPAEADVPCFQLDDSIIWGATYRILAPLVSLLATPTLRWTVLAGPPPHGPMARRNRRGHAASLPNG